MPLSGPVWFRGVRRARYDRLDHNLDTDIAIVGAGITGLTAAVILAREGRRVTVLEADRVASGTSGGTSAHVTEVPDIGYRTLLQRFGNDVARSVVQCNRSGLDFVANIVGTGQIECDCIRVPAYVFSEGDRDLALLDEEVDAAHQAGRMCRRIDHVPLPWAVAGGVEFPDQIALQPLRYLNGLASLATQYGAELFEHTPVIGFRESKSGVSVQTPTGEVAAAALILATHTPLGFNLVQVEVAPYQSYVLALAAPVPLPPALFWDTSDPYFYLRRYDAEDGTPLVILGGADHKTGHDADPEARFALLENYARARFGDVAVAHRWSAELFEPADGLPYIGRSPFAQHTYIATGFSGVGLVQGTMAAMLLAAELRGEPREDPYDVRRVKLGGVPRIVSENLDVAARWIGDRFASAEASSPADVLCGEGRIIKINGERRAVYRDDDGKLYILSPVCTHLGCIVHWNKAERSWDCPCHGARYAGTGEVLEGPALRGLAIDTGKPSEAPEPIPANATP